MPIDQGPDPTFKEQLETTKAYLKEMTERCDKAYADCDERGVEIARLRVKYEATLNKIFQWTTKYGEALCPKGRPDSFGEGMRAAKEQVKALLPERKKQ